MSTTPRTDAHREAMEVEDFDVELAKTYTHAETLERENAAMRNQLERICKEGFGNQDTIGQEPADDYVLRQLAAMREAIREAHAFIERHTYSDHADDCLAMCGPGAECDCGQFKERRRTLSKLQPFLKP